MTTKNQIHFASFVLTLTLPLSVTSLEGKPKKKRANRLKLKLMSFYSISRFIFLPGLAKRKLNIHQWMIILPI